MGGCIKGALEQHSYRRRLRICDLRGKFSIEGNSSSSSIQNVARSERARNYLQRPLGCFGGCKPDSCGDLMYMHGAHRREETRGTRVGGDVALRALADARQARLEA